jgi:hypothetical protein
MVEALAAAAMRMQAKLERGRVLFNMIRFRNLSSGAIQSFAGTERCALVTRLLHECGFESAQIPRSWMSKKEYKKQTPNSFNQKETFSDLNSTVICGVSNSSQRLCFIGERTTRFLAEFARPKAARRCIRVHSESPFKSKRTSPSVDLCRETRKFSLSLH